LGASISSDCAPAACRTTTAAPDRSDQEDAFAPLFIDETAALTVIDLRARARRLARTCGKLGLIVIDYLQLMSARAGSD